MSKLRRRILNICFIDIIADFVLGRTYPYPKYTLLVFGSSIVPRIYAMEMIVARFIKVNNKHRHHDYY